MKRSSFVMAAMFIGVAVVRAAPVGTFQFSTPTGNGTVDISIIDFLGVDVPNVSVQNLPIAMAANATAKRNAIRTALTAEAANAQPVAKRWTFVNQGMFGIDVGNLPNHAVTFNFNPRGTKERRDSMVFNPGAEFKGASGGQMHGHPAGFSLEAEPGVPTEWNAGLVINGVAYEVPTLMGDDSVFDDIQQLGMIQTGLVMDELFARLGALPISPSSAIFSHSPGSPYIDITFGPGAVGETGIIWGTTSPEEEGFSASLTTVPEPATLLFSGVGSLVFLNRRRR